jgi:CRISPR-associated exonuclease Cas4
MITVTDIKQFCYCQRTIFFTYVAPVPRKITRKMEYGKEAHAILDALEMRRKLKRYGLEDGERHFHTYLQSARVGLSGKLDLYLKAGREIFPVEFKNTSKDPFLNHKYQLTAYSLLLEETFHQPIRRGFVCQIEEAKIFPIEITVNMRTNVKEIIQKINTIIQQEKMPVMAESKKKCRDCEYRNFCGDVV